jgi:hypothetical protein
MSRLFATNASLKAAIRRSGIDFLYPLTYDNAYNLGATLPLGDLGCAWAGWIPDFQHRHLPELFSEKERKKRDAGIEALSREAPKMVLSSESSAADFRRFCPQYKGKEFVLSFRTFPNPAWYEDFSGEDLSWLPPRYFVICNQFWSHKNHALVFRALEILCSAEHSVRRCLHWFSPRFSQARSCRTAIAAGASRRNRFAGSDSWPRATASADRDHSAEPRGDSAVALRGWSTVVEDARVLRQAALLSDLDVHREQNPPGAKFFLRNDADALAALMEEAWTTTASRARSRRGEAWRAPWPMRTF